MVREDSEGGESVELGSATVGPNSREDVQQKHVLQQLGKFACSACLLGQPPTSLLLQMHLLEDATHVEPQAYRREWGQNLRPQAMPRLSINPL